MKKCKGKSFFIKLLCNKLSTAIPTQDLIDCEVRSQHAMVSGATIKKVNNVQILCACSNFFDIEFYYKFKL